jgi:hypothetical protein
MKALTRSLALLLLLTVLLAACGSEPNTSSGSPAGAGGSTDGPSEGTPPDEGEGPTDGGEGDGSSTTLEVWFTKGEQLFRSTVTIESTPSVGRAAVEALIAGPPSETAEDGVSTQVPDATEFLGLSIADGIATVDLSGEFATGGGSLSERMRLAQLVFTLTQFPTVKGVLLHMDGKAVEAFSGEGIITDHALKRAEFEDLAPPIVVESPQAGDEVSSPMTIEGTADVYEATVSFRLLDADGKEIASGFATATCGTGCRGDYMEQLKFSVDEKQAGTLEVFESSAENGEPLHMVRVPVVLTP